MNMDDEVICGFHVTAAKKRLFAVYLDLLAEFDRLCTAAGITYWVTFGTLLGAVRHKGFIPWDDDVDIMLPREDYDRLWHMTNEQFGVKAPYFLQNPPTDPSYQQFHMRFRRSDTTWIMGRSRTFLIQHPDREPFNMGINLSLFPLDNWPDDRLVAAARNKASYFFWGLDHRAGAPAKEKPLFHWACKALRGVLGRPLMIRLMHHFLRWPHPGAMVQCLNSYYPGAPCVWPAECFSETIRLPFEDLMVPAPVGYDRILTTTYGDYMQFPPQTEREHDTHGGYYDADTPYPQAIEQLRRSGAL